MEDFIQFAVYHNAFGGPYGFKNLMGAAVPNYDQPTVDGDAGSTPEELDRRRTSYYPHYLCRDIQLKGLKYVPHTRSGQGAEYCRSYVYMEDTDYPNSAELYIYYDQSVVSASEHLDGGHIFYGLNTGSIIGNSSVFKAEFPTTAKSCFPPEYGGESPYLGNGVNWLTYASPAYGNGGTTVPHAITANSWFFMGYPWYPPLPDIRGYNQGVIIDTFTAGPQMRSPQSVTAHSTGSNLLTAHPNPTGGAITVSWDGSDDLRPELLIQDASGRELGRLDILPNGGADLTSLSLSPGAYLASLIQSGAVVAKCKLVVAP